MPPAPAACAVRMMAPRLWGSSTPSSTTTSCEPATSSRSANFLLAPIATTPWWAAVPASRSSAGRGSNRTGTEARRGRLMVCRMWAPPAPGPARDSTEEPRPPDVCRSESPSARLPGFRQYLQPVVEPVGEVREPDHQCDLDNLFIGEVRGQRGPRLRGVGRARQLARVVERGPLLRGKDFIPLGDRKSTR